MSEHDIAAKCAKQVADLQAEVERLRAQQNIWTQWRADVAPWHPLPDAFDCLTYLSTEAAEALDTGLRLKRPADDRTNGHKRNLGRELAQIVDMAYASAIRYGIDLDGECAAWRVEVIGRQR